MNIQTAQRLKEIFGNIEPEKTGDFCKASDLIYLLYRKGNIDALELTQARKQLHRVHLHFMGKDDAKL